MVALSEVHRKIIRAELRAMLPGERTEKIVRLESDKAPPELIRFVRQSCAEIERQNHTEIRTNSTEILRTISPEQWAEFRATAGRLVLAGSLVSSGVALVVYVVIPTAIAIGTALVALAPYFAGGALTVGFGYIVLSEIWAGRKRQPEPKGSGQTYNIYINQGPNGTPQN